MDSSWLLTDAAIRIRQLGLYLSACFSAVQSMPMFSLPFPFVVALCCLSLQHWQRTRTVCPPASAMPCGCGDQCPEILRVIVRQLRGLPVWSCLRTASLNILPAHGTPASGLLCFLFTSKRASPSFHLRTSALCSSLRRLSLLQWKKFRARERRHVSGGLLPGEEQDKQSHRAAAPRSGLLPPPSISLVPTDLWLAAASCLCARAPLLSFRKCGRAANQNLYKYLL